MLIFPPLVMDFSALFRRKSIASTLSDIERTGDAGYGPALKRTLGVRDLTAFGIAAIIGGGIFTAVGNASYEGGPGIIFLYIFTAFACGLAAYCYAEFASTVPISGSAYTYAYVAFGELIAWIIGWDLLMEYAIGNIAVAISWSGYFCNLLEGFHIHIPAFLTLDYPTAHSAFRDVSEQLASGVTPDKIGAANMQGYDAWVHAPMLGGLRLIFDLPALCIVAIITWIVFVGIQESKTAGNIMVALKLVVIFLVIVLGSFYVNPDNWTPFTPNGISGILKGISAVFFAYIGFDAVSTTAEECKNPKRDLPRGMFYSLIICTVLYILISLVLTGMVSYTKLAVDDPLAFVFTELHINWVAYLVSVSAIIATASVLLVFQLGQPRIWMSMSRDGLLPKIFSRIHPKFKTPSFSTILTGLLVAVPALFLNLNIVLALTSIGTLFAFVLVCAGVLVLQREKSRPDSGFRVPYINGKYLVPLLMVTALVLTGIFNRNYLTDLLHGRNIREASSILDKDNTSDADMLASGQYISEHLGVQIPYSDNADSVRSYIAGMSYPDFNKVRRDLPLRKDQIYVTGFRGFEMNIPKCLFILLAAWICIWIYRRDLSLIPSLGLLCCLYLLTGEQWTNWARFIIWLVIGLVIYFSYSRFHSRLKGAQAAA